MAAANHNGESYQGGNVLMASVQSERAGMSAPERARLYRRVARYIHHGQSIPAVQRLCSIPRAEVYAACEQYGVPMPKVGSKSA